MNLMLIDSIDLPFGGAHSVHVSLLMKGIRENKANAFLIIPYGKKREILSPSKRNFGHYDGIPYCFIRKDKPGNKIFRFLDKLVATLNTAALIYKRNKKKKVDAVILGGIVDIIREGPIIFTCALFKIPIFFWLVEKASLNQDYHGLTGYLNYKSQKLTEKYLSKFATGVIIISTRLKKHYLKYIPEQKLLINPILVKEEMKPCFKEYRSYIEEKLRASFTGKQLLVYSGSFAEKDGIFFLLEAINEIVKHYPNVIFIMTGKSENEVLMNKVKAYISQCDLQDKIRLVGFVTSDELIAYNKIADILFVCRSSSPFANHGFPWKLGEYCMTAKPIIATNVSDIDNYFNDNEDLFIVEPNNPQAIANKVSYIFTNYEQALTVAQKGKETALKEFGYLKKSAEVVTFLESALHKP